MISYSGPSVAVWALVLGIPGRQRIGFPYGILATDLTVSRVRGQFSTPLIKQHLASGILGFFLCGVDTRSPVAIITLVHPFALSTAEY